MDGQFVCEVLCLVDDGNDGITSVIGLVFTNVEREGRRLQTSCLAGRINFRDPITTVRDLHLVTDVTLQAGSHRAALHRYFKVDRIEEQSGAALLSDGDIPCSLVVNVGERNGICTSIVGIVGCHADNQFAVVGVEGRATP